ncbi:MAG: hypothetical protein ACPG83_02105, partial [Candidatus Poseidoniaceae archaeon]
MEDESLARIRMPLLLLALLLLSTMSYVNAEETSNEFIIDERLQMVTLLSGETYQQTIEVTQGTIVSVNVGCSSCQVHLDAGDTSITSSSSVTYKATGTTSVQISISSSISETVSTSFLVIYDEDNINQRPSPQSSIDVVDSFRCSSPSECLDMHRGNLKTILNGDYASLGFDAGGVETGSDEYYGFEVQEDEIIELTLHHASDSIRFEFYMQTA